MLVRACGVCSQLASSMNAVHRPGTDEHEPVVFQQWLRGGGGSTFPPSSNHTPLATPRDRPTTPRSTTPRPNMDETVAPSSSPTAMLASSPSAAQSRAHGSGRAKTPVVSGTRSKNAGGARARSAGRTAQPSPPPAAPSSSSHKKGTSFAGPHYRAQIAVMSPAAVVRRSPLSAAVSSGGSSHARAPSESAGISLNSSNSGSSVAMQPFSAASPAAVAAAAAASAAAAAAHAEAPVDRKTFIKLQRTVESLARQLQMQQRLASNAAHHQHQHQAAAAQAAPSLAVHKRVNSIWRAHNAPAEAHLASTLIGAAWRGYTTRRALAPAREDARRDQRVALLEASVQRAEQLRDAQEQATRFLWEEVKKLRMDMADLQTKYEREAHRSHQLAEQLHLVAQTSETLQLTQGRPLSSAAAPGPPVVAVGGGTTSSLSALQQLAAMDTERTPSRAQHTASSIAITPASHQQPHRPTKPSPAASSPSRAGVPAFDSDAFLRGFNEEDELAPPPPPPTVASSSSNTAPAVPSSGGVVSHDPSSSPLVSHFESTPLRFSKLFVDVLQARDLVPPPNSGDQPLLPYAVVTCQSSRGQTDPEEENPHEPQWLTNFVLDVDHDLALNASSRPSTSTSDLSATHVAVSVLSRRLNSSSAAGGTDGGDDLLLGSVLIPLADLHQQMPLVAWYPLHARPTKAEQQQQQRLGSPKSAAAAALKARQVGMVQLALHWIYALPDLAHSLRKRSASELQALFNAVDVNQLFLRVHTADLSAVWPADGEDPQAHAAWRAPVVTLQFQGQVVRSEEGRAPATATDESSRARLARTQPAFDSSRTLSFDVDSGSDDMVLQLSVRRSLRASPEASEQLLAVARCGIAAFADQRTRSLVVTLQHPFTGDELGSVHLSLLWLHNLPSALQALHATRRPVQPA